MIKTIGLKFVIFFTIIFSACNSTDILDDAIIEPRLEITSTNTILRVGETANFTGKYFDEYGVQKDVILSWASTQPQTASVSSSGKTTALAAGSSQIFVQYKNTTSKAIDITVVANDNAVAKVNITATKTNLAVNENLTLNINAQDINGNQINGKTTQWFSENESILKVDGNGKLTAIANGVAAIHGKIEGVKSNSIDFTVGSNELSGSFVAAGGYQASGNASIKVVNGDVILTLADNFQTSFALGTFVYLANSTNGATVRSAGLELGEIKSNGGKTFNVSKVKTDAKLQDYKYVIILCKPASVTFGYAELK